MKIIISMLIFASPLFSHSQEREREGDIYVNEVIIKNKGLIDFIRERVFKVVDSLIVPQTPYIRYIIQFEKKTWIKTYDYNVTIGAYGEPRRFYDNGYDQSIERGYKLNSYITFIDGRKILVRSDLNNPYIDITKKKVCVNQKLDIWFYTGITWNIAMDGDRLIAVNLELDCHPDIRSDSSIRKDFYLLPKECIKEIRPLRLPVCIQIDSMYPPAFINISNIVEVP